MKNFDLKENSYGHKKRLDFIIKQILDYLNHNGKSKDAITILDVGCGSGLLITFPLAKLGYNILGIDIDEDSIKFAKEKNIYGNASFLHSDLSDIKDQYDIIIASEILEHLSNPASFLRELTNKMASDSILILTTPNGYG
jgi:2-polyprenyl-6-hydroxyphenyl methylase/3-demethylubiquinone-9 3-methyltransferase